MSAPFRKTQREALVAQLLKWYRRHKRNLPWRGTRDPYRIWVSEVMLQQTRVTTVVPYYERFLARFPHVEALVGAPEQELLEAWSGLGYYRRARQMQAAAREIAERYQGRMPRQYDDLLQLPGIGEYTAAAIASIAFHRPHAVVDGNVLRLLTRLLDDDGEITRADVRARLKHFAQSLLDAAGPRQPGHFNQAAMELGATLCAPRNPRCLLCPVADYCRARRRGVEQERPVKPKQQRVERLEVAVALVRRGSSLLMRRRPSNLSLMPGFWELPEASAPRLGRDCLSHLGIVLSERLGSFRHGITFHDYSGVVYDGTCNGSIPKGYIWVSANRMANLPLTTLTRKALTAAGNPPTKPASPKLFDEA